MMKQVLFLSKEAVRPCVWDMEEIEEASKQGKEVPPTYVNVTDAVSLACDVH